MPSPFLCLTMFLPCVKSAVQMLSRSLRASLDLAVWTRNNSAKPQHTPKNSATTPYTYRTSCTLFHFTRLHITWQVSPACLYFYTVLSLESNCCLMFLIEVRHSTTLTITENIQRQWQMDNWVWSIGGTTLKGKKNESTQWHFSFWPGI